MSEFSERVRLIRYEFGTTDGTPPNLDLRHDPALTDSFDTNEFVAGLVARHVAEHELVLAPGAMPAQILVALGTMTMAFKTHPSVQLLCRHGYPEDAFARVRTLFEIALDLRYMRHEPNEESARAKRWLDWAKVVQYRLLGVVERGGDYFDDVRKALAEHEEEINAVTAAIEQLKAEDSHWFTNKKGKPQLHSHW